MHHKILVLGADGQVGRALKNLLGNRAIFLSKKQLDLKERAKITKILNIFQFDILINAAAYTKVDQAEEQQELAYLVNDLAVEELALYCQSKNIIFVHYSTDYVFDGTKNNLILEEDQTNPLSIYGKTKLAGENKLKNICEKYLILRTSWVYSHQGNNFLQTMLKLAQTNEIISVVGDQFGSPTYSLDLANATLLALNNAKCFEVFPQGIYHLTNSGYTSWHGFARKIFSLAKEKNIPLLVKELNNITSKEYPTLAKRPNNSRLCCDKIQNTLDITMKNWEVALECCMNNFLANQQNFK